MTFSLSTRWNAYRHASGEGLVEEILGLGFSHVELGYDLRLGLVPGVLAMIDTGAVTATSVHNFCPVPTSAPGGHPELFSLCSSDRNEWNAAQRHTSHSIEFAARAGARVIVVHAGRVPMTQFTHKLLDLCGKDKRYHPKFDRIKDKLLLKRSRKGPPHIDALYAAIEQLLPVLETNHICLAIENLPSWEAVPTEQEMDGLLTRFESPLIAYWHDIGHAQIRHNLGFINHLHWLEKLSPRMAGMHIHDVAPPGRDHLMPPRGEVDFTRIKRFIRPDTLLVLEPAPGTPGAEILAGRAIIEEAWAPDAQV